MRILNVESELFHSFTDQDNIQYDLFVSTEDNKGMVRIRDLDANETVSLKKYPSVKDAEQAYNKLIRQVKASIKNAEEINYPGHGWSPEQQLNRHTYPALGKIKTLMKNMENFVISDLKVVDFENKPEKKKQLYSQFINVSKILEKLHHLLSEYVSQKKSSFVRDIKKAFKRKVSYLQILAKIFNVKHHQKMGQFLQEAKEILNVLISSRTYMPPERYQEAKSLLKELISEMNRLMELIIKF
jgi:hypothetical protein